ncbi:MAG: polysaccharide biosynthesis protein [Bacillota bacterium]|nr:polysaccharide biosynthesis protein [Bacillota bacterium]
MIKLKCNKKIFWDTGTLLFSNIAVKGLGFVYRVMLVRLLGSEGIGLVEMSGPLFSFLLVLSGLGLQTAMTQRIAKNPEKRFLFLSTARAMLLCSGLLVSILAYIAAPLLIRIAAPDQRVLPSFLAILPAIPIISFASAYRGYLQGLRRMKPIAASQNLEQLSRSLLGLFLAKKLLEKPLEMAAAAPSLATVFGEAAGLLLLLLCLPQKAKSAAAERQKFSLGRCLRAGREMLTYGLPLTAGRLASSGITMLQAMLIPACLQKAGWDMAAATSLYGQFSGVALALLHLPGVFTSALSTVIMPAVAESSGKSAHNNALLQHRIRASLRATIFCTVPGMLLLYIFAEPYCILIFDKAPAAPLLRILSLGGIFFYLQISLCSILQGMGEVRRLLCNSLISGGILLLGIRLLAAAPSFGIAGAAIACSISWLSAFLLNAFFLRKKCGFSLGLAKMSLPPLLAAAGSLLLYKLGAEELSTWLPLTKISTTLIQSMTVVLIYVLLLFLYKQINLRK